MKIGVSSYSFSKYMKASGCNYLDICDLAKEMGFDGIEFTDLMPEVSGCDAMTAAKQIREHCAEIGLEITAHTVGANFLKDDPDAEVERVKALVDVAAELGRRKRPGQVLVAFAAETNDVEDNARGKLVRKNADLVVANDVTRPGAGFGADTNIVTLVTRDGLAPLPKQSKRAVADAILDRVRALMENA